MQLEVRVPEQVIILESNPTIQDTALMAITASNNANLQTLLSLAMTSNKELQEEIIRRESGGDPKICNYEFGCGAGMGLCGFIPPTWNRTLDRMTCSGKFNTQTCIESYLPQECNEKVFLPVSKEKKEKVFDVECHMIVCDWLLSTDGIRHWESDDGSWGSGPYDLSKY